MLSVFVFVREPSFLAHIRHNISVCSAQHARARYIRRSLDRERERERERERVLLLLKTTVGFTKKKKKKKKTIGENRPPVIIKK